MKRLEEIVEQMESGELPLEDLIVRYEEGMKLVKVCQERLATAEERIEIITRNSAGKPVVKDFAHRRGVPPLQRHRRKEKENRKKCRRQPLLKPLTNPIACSKAFARRPTSRRCRKKTCRSSRRKCATS